MRHLLVLAIAVLPWTATAGVVFEVESTHDSAADAPYDSEMAVEGKNLKMEILPSGEPDPKNTVLIRRIDGGVTVLVIDHGDKTIGAATFPYGPGGLGLMPSGRIAMAPGGIKLHVGGGPSDVWIQTPRTGMVGEILQWVDLVQRISLDLGDQFPEPFDDGFLSGETTLRFREERRLDPEAFEPPKGYRPRQMLDLGGGSSGGNSAAPATTNSGGGGGAVSSTMTGAATQ